LPDGFGIHPTVNVARLKRYVDGAERFPDREVEDWRPTGEKVRDANGQLEYEVDTILAQRGRERNRSYLVKWKGYPLWEATWEVAGNLTNAKAALGKFQKKAEQVEKERGEQLMAIFKGVKSVTGEISMAEEGFKRFKGLMAESGLSVSEVLKHLIDEL
jgi:hypothetical protein